MRYLSSGESHGPILNAIIEGLPAGLEIDPASINSDLQKRQQGFGRGNRMKIEDDEAEILSGIRNGKTTGSPLSIQIRNRDWDNWRDKNIDIKTIPRPGHADLPGALKYDTNDIQDIIERASARETAIKVAVGSIAKNYLAKFDIDIIGHTHAIGGIYAENIPENINQLKKAIDRSSLRCADKHASQKIMERIQKAIERGTTLGGVVEIRIYGVPIGIGSYVHWDLRLSGLLAQALISIPSAKAVEIGDGIANAVVEGQHAHDAIYYSPEKHYYRETNRAGGIEGGISNGETIIMRVYFKPIPTLKNSLPSVDMSNHNATKAPYVRSDTTIVPCAGVIAEASAAWVLADCYSRKFGGDSLKETLRNYKGYIEHIRTR